MFGGPKVGDRLGGMQGQGHRQLSIRRPKNRRPADPAWTHQSDVLCNRPATRTCLRKGYHAAKAQRIRLLHKRVQGIQPQHSMDLKCSANHSTGQLIQYPAWLRPLGGRGVLAVHEPTSLQVSDPGSCSDLLPSPWKRHLQQAPLVSQSKTANSVSVVESSDRPSSCGCVPL